MSDLSRFLKKNKPVAANEFYPATRSLVDENGAPLLWELRRLTSKQNADIQNDCMVGVTVKKRTEYKFNTAMYLAKIAAASVVFPDLQSSELQVSYGASNPENLIMEMIDDPGEWNAFVTHIQELNGFDKSLGEDIDEAKNS